MLAQTVRHFWPDFPPWLRDLPDTRFQPFVVYEAPFLLWWGLLLFLAKLGRTRQLDYQLRDLETLVLANVNALAQTEQETLPVCGTLSHYLSHLGPGPLAELRARMVRTLIRGKALDRFRLLGRWFVVAVDGTGLVFFSRRHCPHCLTMTLGERTYYYHNVLEAKLVTANGLALSIASVLIDNRHVEGLEPADAEAAKQDCELKAFCRLAPQLKAAFPQTPLCIAGDSLLACGPVLQSCRDNGWAFALTFKPGRTPACWEEFQALLKLDCRGGAGQQRPLVVETPDGVRQQYGWVSRMPYVDSENRQFSLNAIQCVQTRDGQSKTFAWLTNIRVTDKTVPAIAHYAGRDRWKIENSGFNTQKNGGYELEHVYGERPDLMECYYILLQIAHMIWQLVEKGSLLRKVAQKYGKTVVGLYGSVRNIARRLLDCLRYHRLPPEAFEPARRFQIRLDSS